MTLNTPTQPGSSGPGSSGSVTRLTHAVALVGAVRGSLRSGLLEALWRWQPCTPHELATRAHLTPAAVERTLAALAVGGVVTEQAGRWVPTAPPEAWARLVDFEQHIWAYIDTGAATCADGNDRYTGVLPAIGRLHEPVAARFAPSLARPGARMLELGAGTAPWSRALLAVEPTMYAVAVDLPPVIARLEQSIAGTPLSQRIECRAGDVRDLELAERFELIVVAGLCRLLAEAVNAELFARCRHLLAPGGRLVVCDALAGTADPDGSLALYALGLAARSHGEALWGGADYERWLRRAGLAAPQVVPTGRAEVTVLLSGLEMPTATDPATTDPATTDPATATRR